MARPIRVGVLGEAREVVLRASAGLCFEPENAEELADAATELAHNGRILEVANVRSHYFPVQHDILDKYEQVDGIFNEDVVDYMPHRPYDRIVSVSPLEHVGWDEERRDPGKVQRARHRLEGLVKPGELLILTVALGHHPHLDSLLARGVLSLTEQRYLRR